MPRPPTYQHPLRDIREATEMSQGRMAHLLGISRSMLQKIENGQKILPPRLALLVQQMTGCDIRRTSSEPMIEIRATKDGNPFTVDDYQKHVDSLRTRDPFSQPIFEACVEVLRLHVSVAAKEGILPLLLADLGEMLLKWHRTHDLTPQITEYLSEPELGLEDDVQGQILGLLPVSPLVAGTEISVHRGTKDRIARTQKKSREQNVPKTKRSPRKK